MPLRTGVIGTGTVAQNNHLPALTRNPRTQLTAVCDTDGDRARDAGFEYGARPYVDVDSLVATEELDWVHIATPVGTHRELAAVTIEAGIPTTIQKPATRTLEELDELQSLADHSDVPVSVVHNWLYYPVIREVRRRVHTGEIGRIRAVETTFAGEGDPNETYRGSWVFDLPGGEFEEGMPHPLYLTLALGGDPRNPAAVDIRTRCAGDYDGGFTYDGVTLQYESNVGALCSIVFLSGAARTQELRVHGENGALAVDLASRTIRSHAPDAGPYHFFRERLTRNRNDIETDLVGLATNLALRVKERCEEALDWHLEDSPDGHYFLLNQAARALQQSRRPPVPLARSRWPIAFMERVRTAATKRTSTGR